MLAQSCLRLLNHTNKPQSFHVDTFIFHVKVHDRLISCNIVAVRKTPSEKLDCERKSVAVHCTPTG